MMYLTRAQVRDIDRRAIEEFGVPGVVLMENAGRGAAELLLALGAKGPVAICCGKGNNGGDGFVIARHLDNHAVPVRVLLFTRPEQLTGDAAINFHIIQRSGVAVLVEPDLPTVTRELDECAWAVDALFGTGLTGPIRQPLDRVVAAINGSGKPVLAVDIPSGLDCDTGLALGETVRVAHTATFVAPKVGFANPAASQWLGQVHVVDIGVPRAVFASTGS
jgi:NAD(P)H-hydrate epimerase